MDSEALIVTQVEDGITSLTLNRPHELNAWTYDLEREFFATLEALRTDPATRVVMITGRGKGFCAGMSMTSLRDIESKGCPGVQSEGRPRLTQIIDFPKPTIAVINGAAAGIGLSLALHCDLRFASCTAKLTTSFPRRGLVAEHGMAWLLPRLIGIAHAQDLLLSGRVVQGDEAYSLGLVNYSVPDNELEAVSLSYARDLVRHGSPRSWQVIKEQMARALQIGRDESFSESMEFAKQSLTSVDFLEGMAAYREKRPAAFPPLGSSAID